MSNFSLTFLVQTRKVTKEAARCRCDGLNIFWSFATRLKLATLKQLSAKAMANDQKIFMWQSHTTISAKCGGERGTTSLHNTKPLGKLDLCRSLLRKAARYINEGLLQIATRTDLAQTQGEHPILSLS